MASAFSHAFVAIALGKTYTGAQMPWRFWMLSAGCAVVPDVDVVGFAFGIRYGDMLGHRGLTHSLACALLLACVVVWFAFRDVPRLTRAWWTLVAYFFVVTASHGVLDALTNGGLGVAFFAPFAATRLAAAFTTTSVVVWKERPSRVRSFVPLGMKCERPSGDSSLSVTTPAAWLTSAAGCS